MRDCQTKTPLRTNTAAIGTSSATGHLAAEGRARERTHDQDRDQVDTHEYAEEPCVVDRAAAAAATEVGQRGRCGDERNHPDVEAEIGERVPAPAGDADDVVRREDVTV